MTTKEELRQLVDILSDAEAAELLDYAHWLREETEELTPEELVRVRQGEEEIQRGETVSWDELRSELNL